MRGSNSNYPSCPSSSVPRQIYSPATPSLFCTPKPPTSSTWVGARTGAGGGGRGGDQTIPYLDCSGGYMTIKKKALVAQLCPTLCHSLDCSSPGSSVHGILEWVAIPFSRGSSWHRDWIRVSCSAGRLYHLSHQGSPIISQNETSLEGDFQCRGHGFDPSSGNKDPTEHYTETHEFCCM